MADCSQDQAAVLSRFKPETPVLLKMAGKTRQEMGTKYLHKPFPQEVGE